MPDNPWERRAAELKRSGATDVAEPEAPAIPANPWAMRAEQLESQGDIGRFEPVRPGMTETPEQRYLTGLRTTMKPEHLGLPPRSEWEARQPMGIAGTLADEWTGQNLVRKIPVAGLAPDIGEAAAGLIILKRLKQDMAGKVPAGFSPGEWEMERNAHIQFLRGLQIKSDFAESQGYTFGGKVAQVVSQLPTFLAEFWLSGGIAGGAKKAVAKLGAETTGNVLKRAAVKAGVWGLQKAAAASVRTATSMIGRAINDSLQRQLPEDVTVDERGNITFAGGDQAAVAWAKGFADTWIEALSEDLGADIAKVGRLGKIAVFRKLAPSTRRAIKPFLSPLKALQKSWLKARPGKTANDFAKALFGGVGFDGTVEEMLEERAGDVLRAISGVEDISVAQALFPGWEQLAVEAVSFSVPGAMRAGTALAKSVLDGEQGARERAKALAAKAMESDNPKIRQFAENLDKQLAGDGEVEEGLLKRVIEAGELLEQAEQGRAPEDSAATLLEDIELIEKAAEPAEFAPEKAGPPAAPREAPKPKPAAPPKPTPVAADEAAARVGEMQQQIAPEVEVLAAKAPKDANVGASYRVRKGDVDLPLEAILAAEATAAQPAQALDLLLAAKEEAGEQMVARTLGIMQQAAPAQWEKQGRKLIDALDIQPQVPGSGVLPLEMIEGEFKRLRKLMPAGLAKQIMQDVTFWREGMPINVTPKKLEAFVERMQVKAKRAFYIGAVSKQMQDKELVAWAKETLPDRAYKMIAGAMERIAKTRTPAERARVVEAINKMVEKHNRQVALQKVRERLKEVRGSKLLEVTKNQVAALLDGIAERKPSAAAIGRARERLAAARREIQQRIKAGMPEDMAFTAIPLKALQRAEKVLERAEARPLTDLSAEELATLDEAVGHLLAQDRLKKQLMGRQARRKSMDAAETSAREIEARHSQKYGDIEAMSLVNRVIRQLSKAPGWWTSAETRIYMLAGEGSLPQEILWHNRREGDSDTAAHYQGVYDDYTSALHKANIAARDMRTWSAVKTPLRKTLKDTPLGRGRSTRLTPFERIDLYLNLMDPDTRAKILGGEGIYIGRYEKTFDMSAADVDAFLREGGIDRNERAVAHIFSALINGERAIAPVAGVRTDGVGEALNRVWLRMFGTRIATRRNYWSRYLKLDLGFRDPNALFREEQRRLTEEAGIFKPREGGEQAVAITDAAVKFDRTVSTMCAMAGRTEAVHNAMRLLTEPAFTEAVKRAFRDGTRVLEDLKRDVLDWAAPPRRELHGLERAIDKMLRLLQIKTLAPSPRVIAYQTLSLPTAGLVVPTKYLASARALAPAVKATTQEIREHWPLGRARMEGSMHDVVTPGRASTRMWQLMGVDKLSTRLSNLSMEAIHQADALVIDTIWRACKLWAKADGLTGEAFWREVRKRAQYAVDATQPSTDVGVLSGMQKLTRKSPVAKLIPGMLFSSQRNKLANLQMKELSDWAADGFSARSAMRHIARLSVSSIINAVGLAVISGTWVALVTAMGGGDDDKWLNRLYRDFMRRLWGSWILAGDLANIPFNIVESWRGNVPPSFAQISDNLLISNLNDVIAMLQAMGPWIAESDPKNARKRRDQIVKRALRLVGMNDLNRWLRARKQQEQRKSKVYPY